MKKVLILAVIGLGALHVIRQENSRRRSFVRRSLGENADVSGLSNSEIKTLYTGLKYYPGGVSSMPAELSSKYSQALRRIAA
ncbi:hypothetical protein [Robiginitalea biformata]|uniref:hypothetical protein n=1 Tax=Robiginitalea biformata TaxID=252307 RepID=UPI0003252ABB|nr:hypothetical protein [Robiginitalea biformata]